MAPYISHLIYNITRMSREDLIGAIYSPSRELFYFTFFVGFIILYTSLKIYAYLKQKKTIAATARPTLNEDTSILFTPQVRRIIGKIPKEYDSQEYWERRYRVAAVYHDWYIDWSKLKPHADALLAKDKDSKILVVGCGNSTLSEELYKEGFKNVTSVDFSKVVIEQMKESNKNKPELKWYNLDLTNLNKFSPNTFDAVIDKATLDSVFFKKNVTAEEKVDKILNELLRVSKIDSLLISISWRDVKEWQNKIAGRVNTADLSSLTDPHGSAGISKKPYYNYLCSKPVMFNAAKVKEAKCYIHFLKKVHL